MEIEGWIDAHYVPSPFAEEVLRLTGFFVESIQEPCCWLQDGDRFWPESGRATNERRRNCEAMGARKGRRARKKKG
jgi:hypothetical protein